MQERRCRTGCAHTHVHKDVKGDLHPPKHSTYYTPKHTVHITHTPVLVCANTYTNIPHSHTLSHTQRFPEVPSSVIILFHWPVPPLGDPHTLDDVDRHLEEENKEEEEEAEGTVRPEEDRNQDKGLTITRTYHMDFTTKLIRSCGIKTFYSVK